MSLCTQSRQLGGGLDGLQLRFIQSTLHSICDRGSLCLELRLGSGRLLRSSLFPCLCVLLVIFFLGLSRTGAARARSTDRWRECARAVQLRRQWAPAQRGARRNKAS
jgi:hypothetical protein